MTSIITINYCCLILVIGGSIIGAVDKTIEDATVVGNLLLSNNGLENKTNSKDNFHLELSDKPLLVSLNDAHQFDLHKESGKYSIIFSLKSLFNKINNGYKKTIF